MEAINFGMRYNGFYTWINRPPMHPRLGTGHRVEGDGLLRSVGHWRPFGGRGHGYKNMERETPM